MINRIKVASKISTPKSVDRFFFLLFLPEFHKYFWEIEHLYFPLSLPFGTVFWLFFFAWMQFHFIRVLFNTHTQNYLSMKYKNNKKKRQQLTSYRFYFLRDSRVFNKFLFFFKFQHTTLFMIIMRLNLKYVLSSLILMVTFVTLMLWHRCDFVRTFPKRFYSEYN